MNEAEKKNTQAYVARYFTDRGCGGGRGSCKKISRPKDHLTAKETKTYNH